MTLTVRDATRADADAIARLRVETWRAAYAGLISADVLDQLDAEREGMRRAAHWDEHHSDPRGGELIAERDGVVVGWAVIGTSRDHELPNDGEVYAMYAIPAEWSRGVGHALMLAAEDRLRSAGFRRAHLWVLEGNDRAASFYQRHGWREDGGVLVDERVIGGRTAYTLHERRRVRDLTPQTARQPPQTARQPPQPPLPLP